MLAQTGFASVEGRGHKGLNILQKKGVKRTITSDELPVVADGNSVLAAAAAIVALVPPGTVQTEAIQRAHRKNKGVFQLVYKWLVKQADGKWKRASSIPELRAEIQKLVPAVADLPVSASVLATPPPKKRAKSYQLSPQQISDTKASERARVVLARADKIHVLLNRVRFEKCACNTGRNDTATTRLVLVHYLLHVILQQTRLTGCTVG
jgi:hypothetical protein